MLDWLDRQRKKPKEARIRIAFFFAVSFTAVIGIIWLTSLSVRMGEFRIESDGGTEENLNEFLESTRNSVESAIDSAGEEGLPATTTPTTTRATATTTP